MKGDYKMERIPFVDWRSSIVILLVGIILIFTAGCGNQTNAEEDLTEIRLDYAYYSPTSLALKEFGWVEEAFEEEGIKVEWTLSQGSNKALEFLNSNSIDFGSTAGAAALISKANGAPIQNVYIFSKPEWTALVTTEDSDIQTIADLKGKQVAATLGTDPYIFLVRALAEEGLSENDITLTNLQHADGATALINGDVDAWAGLDPHMAKYEVENNTPLFYRNIDFNTYGFLNVREEFAENYPDHVKKVIEAYEKARQWVLENPEEAAELLAEEAGIDLEVAKIQMERNDFSNPIPGDIHLESIEEAGNLLQQAEVLKSDIDVKETAESLIEPKFSEEVIGGQ